MLTKSGLDSFGERLGVVFGRVARAAKLTRPALTAQFYRPDALPAPIKRDLPGANVTHFCTSLQPQQEKERVTKRAARFARRPLVMFLLLSLQCRAQMCQVSPPVGQVRGGGLGTCLSMLLHHDIVFWLRV